MSLRIIRYPHPTLRYRSQPIRRVDRELKALAAEMLDLMYQAEGVGLAANQVNLPLRMFVCNPTGSREEKSEEMILINPLIKRPRGSDSAQEGCLSLPGMFAQVKRPIKIRLNAFDLSGNEIDRDFDGFLSRVIQHENDHLDGVLFFDRLSDEAKREVSPSLTEFEHKFEAAREKNDLGSDADLLAELDRWTEKYA